MNATVNITDIILDQVVSCMIYDICQWDYGNSMFSREYF